MASMDCKIGENIVGKVLNYKHLPKAQKIISTALDGTTYGQKTGDAIQQYSVDVYCSTEAKRNSIDLACGECTELTIVLRDGTTEVTGVIEDETVEWKEWEDGHAVGRFTLSEV